MENELKNVSKNNKTNFILISIIFILIVIIAVIISWNLGYNKASDENANSNKNQNISEKEEVQNNSNNIESSTQTEAKQLNLFDNSKVIVHSGNVYLSVDESQNRITTCCGAYFKIQYNSNIYQAMMNVKNKYQNYDIKATNLSTFNGLKLNVSDVKSVYENKSGQAISETYGIIMLHNDGTLSFISLYDFLNGSINVETINGISNITDVVSKNVPMGGMVTYAVTASGEEIDLFTYIK